MASKVLQVAAVGLQKLVYEGEGILNDFIPLRGEHIPPRVADIRSNAMNSIKEELDVRVEMLLRYRDSWGSLLFFILYFLYSNRLRLLLI